METRKVTVKDVSEMLNVPPELIKKHPLKIGEIVKYSNLPIGPKLAVLQLMSNISNINMTWCS